MSRRILVIAALSAIILASIGDASAKTKEHHHHKHHNDHKNAMSFKLSYDELARESRRLAREAVDGKFMDMRGGVSMGQKLTSYVYLGIAAAYSLFMLYAVWKTLGYIYTRVLHNDEPFTDEEIENIDNNSVSVFTVKELNELNNKRDEAKRLNRVDLMFTWQCLQDRAEFEPDDTFSQKTAVRCYIEAIRSGESGSSLKLWEEDQDKFLKSDSMNRAANHRQFASVYSLKNALIGLCTLTNFTASLALILIFGQFISGDRLICLVPVDNSILRILFIIIVLLISLRDLAQIRINMSIRYSGVVYDAENSWTLFMESWIRQTINLYSTLTMLLVILSHPAHDDEGPIDQTMNFTALVILLEIDNILGAIYNKKIEFYDTPKQFEYNQEKLPAQFNQMADFILARREAYPCWETFEGVMNWMFKVLLWLTLLVIPVFYLLIYLIIPPTEAKA